MEGTCLRTRVQVWVLAASTLVLPTLPGCSAHSSPASAPVEAAAAPKPPEPSRKPPRDYVGFDLNDYPGDDAMAKVKPLFAYTGFWLTPPPGLKTNTWIGRRSVLRAQGWGFLVLANGRLEKEIKASRLNAADLGRQDAATAIAAARSEGFPPRTILFLDQEEGGRLTDPQIAYLFGWTEAVAASVFGPGVYASGQAVPDGPGATITTIQDIREHVAARHLHPIAVWVYQDACPPQGPAPGCTLKPPPATLSGTPDITAWQYAQSPRRPEITQSCAKTYRADGNCTPPGAPDMLADLNVAASADPSAGR